MLTMSQLKNQFHSTDAEVIDAVKALKTAREAIGGSMSLSRMPWLRSITKNVQRSRRCCEHGIPVTA
jgi:hypothetical protein